MTWKHVTRSGINYFINLDEIAYLQQGAGYTSVVFNAAKADSVISLTVDQSPLEILAGEKLS